MKYIVISGIDGSGKTTIIKELQSRLHQQGLSTGYIWMRYNHYLVKMLNAVARVTGLSVPATYGEKKVWEHRYYRSGIFYRLYIFCAYIDNVIAARKVRKLARRGFQYIICDRWINDIITDIGSEFRRQQIVDSVWYRRFQEILPPNTIQFVVSRPRPAVLQSRADNQHDIHFHHRLEIYQKLAREGHAIEVDNSGDIEDSVSYILKKIC